MEENNEIKKEEKNNIHKKKIPIYLYIIGIVVVLILILIISLVVVSSKAKEEVETPPPKVEEPVTPPSISNLTEEDAKKIYQETLPFIKNYVGASIHHIDKMTVSNANTNFLRSFAFSKIEFPEIDLKLKWKQSPDKEISLLMDVMDIDLDEIVEWYIELLEVGSKKYIVPHTKPYLESVRTQLLACFKRIMEVKIVNPTTRPIIDIQYPKGYEG